LFLPPAACCKSAGQAYAELGELIVFGLVVRGER